MTEEKKLAVLIDSDNVSAKYAQFIMDEVKKYGSPTYKRVYGDWEKGGNGWHSPAMSFSLMPVQQMSYVAGKNATDFSMIIDAMDILYTGDVDGFVLVTSDSDFTRLAIRLREAGKLVIGIGEIKTPRPFTISCHHFTYLNQVGNMETDYTEEDIRKAVLNIVADNRDSRLDLAKINAILTSKFGNIDFESLGYRRFSTYIDSFPELRRNNKFVTMRKKKTESASAVKEEKATFETVTAAMSEFLQENQPEKDNMLKLESWLTARFGKIDFAKFGSGKFAKFIDRLPQFSRTGTLVRLTSTLSQIKPDTDTYRKELISYVGENMPNGINVGQLNNHLMEMFGKDYYKELGFEDFKSALDSVPEVKSDENNVTLAENVPAPEKPANLPSPSTEVVFARIRQYAAENMPDGGNIGQLNNELIGVYGKDYVDALGYGDFRALLSAVPDVRVSRNKAYSTAPVEIAAETMPEKPQSAPAKENASEQKAEPAAEEAAEPAEETAPAETENAPREYEKPELNAVKREILQTAASSDNGVSITKLGGILGAKYGHDFLKELGLASMRKLTAEISGTFIRNNRLYISEEFAKQTDEIEHFVNDFARSEGSRSIRALGIQLKERFEGFDYRNYGFARFTDFINAIDGVRADRYHIKPVD